MIRKLLAISALLIMAHSLIAQDVTVSGKVTTIDDPSGLPGVNVLLKGTTNGAITDVNGDYRLVVPSSGGTLIFSFIGYQTVEEQIGSRSTIDIVLDAEVSQLQEIVVVGYGSKSQEALTGSVATVGADKLEQVPMASFEQVLQGNVAGLQTVSLDGSPGGNSQIRIRGIGSITASSEPLYVVDGIPVQSGDITLLNSNGNRSGNVMASMNPNDIASVTVLKDAASTAIYGSRGANGVILITTKRGKSGKPRVDFRSQVGFNSVASNSLLEPLNADQYTQLFLEGYTNNPNTTITQAEAQANFDSRFRQLTDADGNRTDTNWLEELTRTGVNHSYDLSLSGGTEGLNYFFSGGYFEQESHIIGTDFERFSTRMNLDFAVNDNISITNNLNVSHFDQNGMVDGTAWANPMYNALLLSPLIPVRDEQGRFNDHHKTYFPMGGNNPVGALSGDDIRNTRQIRVIDNFSVTVKFLEDFSFRTQWNIDFIQVGERQYKNRRYGDGRNSGGFAQESTRLNRNYVGTQTLSYGKTLSDIHNITVLAGYEAQKSDDKWLYGYAENFPNDKLRNLASAADADDADGERSEYSFLSIFSRVDYDYSGKYFASFSIRRDGSSRFGIEERWGTFGSFGLGWALHEEGFLSGVDAINNLKLRSSYGVTGNAAIGNFPSVGLYDYGFDYAGEPGGEPDQISNPILTWEKQNAFNLGLDFHLFQKVSGTVEYFNKVSSDLILDVPVSRTTGFEELTQNFGEMENKGIEIAIDANIVESGDFTFDAGFNITFLSNEITKLQEDFDDGTKRRAEGMDFQSYFMREWAGVDADTGAPLWYTDATRTETTSAPEDAEEFFVGKSATPDYYGGFNFQLGYKGFDLSAQFSYSQGNYLYDPSGFVIHGDGAFTPRGTSTWGFENRWVPGKTDAKLPRHYWGNNDDGNETSTRYLYDGSFTRLRNLTLSYTIPGDLVSKLNMRFAKVYLRGTNLLTFQKDEDAILDPEQAINGIANRMVPAIKTISFGVDLGL